MNITKLKGSAVRLGRRQGVGGVTSPSACGLRTRPLAQLVPAAPGFARGVFFAPALATIACDALASPEALGRVGGEGEREVTVAARWRRRLSSP